MLQGESVLVNGGIEGFNGVTVNTLRAKVHTDEMNVWQLIDVLVSLARCVSVLCVCVL